MKVARYLPLTCVLLSMMVGSFLSHSDVADPNKLPIPTFNGKPAPLAKLTACTPLSVGDFLNVQDLKMPYLGSYKLIHSSTDLYEAVLNLNFIPAKNATMSTDQIKTQATALFNRCFGALGDIESPDGGSRLRVRLGEPGDIGPPATPVDVTILTEWQPRIDRSTTWSLQSDCPTILHETMHILGMLDEYPETAIGTNADPGTGNRVNVLWNAQSTWYDCRSLGAKDSVMYSMDAAVAAVSQGFETISCSCENSACAKKLDALSGAVETCPEGSDQRNYPIVGFNDYTVKTDAKTKTSFDEAYQDRLNGQRANRWIYETVVPIKPSRAWFLYPAEYRSIVSPGCLTSNPIFYRCSLNAWMTSTAHYGEGCFVDVPKACDDPGVWLQ